MPPTITTRRRLLLAASVLAVAGRRLFAHEIDRSWPAGRIVQAQVSGVAVDPRGRILVLNRGEKIKQRLFCKSLVSEVGHLASMVR
jgi:hypothetical protein